MKFLHCADLHLSQKEKEYSLSVLEEIVYIAAKEHSTLIFAGDTFDSFEDLEILRSEFRKQIGTLKTEILFIPGNHERLKGGKRSIKNLDLGNIICTDTSPQVHTVEDTEFLLIPFMDNYNTYREWDLPEKIKACRVAVIHGSVSGMTYIWSEGEEETTAAIDCDLFDKLKVDYAALGHIHIPKKEKAGKTLLCYPGSSRVWRKGEEGKRQVILVDTLPELTLREIPLENAGEYRFVNLNLDSLEELSQFFPGPKDYVEISLCGVTDNEALAEAAEKRVRENLKKRVRVLEVERSRVIILEEMSRYPVVKRFLELWRGKKPGDSSRETLEAWQRARDLGILKMKEIIEAGR